MKVPISKSIFTQEDMSHVLQPLSDGWGFKAFILI